MNDTVDQGDKAKPADNKPADEATAGDKPRDSDVSPKESGAGSPAGPAAEAAATLGGIKLRAKERLPEATVPDWLKHEPDSPKPQPADEPPKRPEPPKIPEPPRAQPAPSASTTPAPTESESPQSEPPEPEPTPEPAPPPPPPAPEPVRDNVVIEASQLALTFVTRDGPVEALSGIDLKIEQGEFVSLIGPSGCGKTTLLRVIADLEQPTGGNITVDGLSPAEAREQRAYGYVFQAPALFPWRNIARNVALPLEVMGLGSVERERRVAMNLELVNLNGFEKKYPWQLSGGMQQRVSIARALAVEPDLLLMDEPFGALDEIVRDHLNEQLHQLWSQTKKTVVFVTHSIPEAVFLSTRIVVMTPRPGKIYDVIDSPLPRARTLDLRDTPEFLEVAHRVRDGLKAGHAYED